MAKKSAPSDLVQPYYSHALAYIRRSSVVILIVIACVSVVLFTFIHWFERQVLTTDNWVQTVSVLPSTPVVSTALGTYISEQIYANVPVQQEILNVLPPKASFLAAPLATQLKTLVTQVSERIVKSNTFTQVWTAANRSAMTTLLTNARSPAPPSNNKINQLFSLNLSGVQGALQKALGSTGLAFPALQSNSNSLVDIQANLDAKRHQVWTYIRITDYLRAVLPFVIAATLLGALALAYNRRRLLLIFSISTIVLLLLEIIAVKILRGDILGQVKNATYQPAVGYIFDSLTSSLRTILYVWLGAGVVVTLLCIVFGPYYWADNARSRVSDKFNFISQGLTRWRVVRDWTRHYLLALLGGIAICLLIWLAFVAGISAKTLTQDILFAVVLAEIACMIAFSSLSYPRGKEHGGAIRA